MILHTKKSYTTQVQFKKGYSAMSDNARDLEIILELSTKSPPSIKVLFGLNFLWVEAQIVIRKLEPPQRLSHVKKSTLSLFTVSLQ